MSTSGDTPMLDSEVDQPLLRHRPRKQSFTSPFCSDGADIEPPPPSKPKDKESGKVQLSITSIVIGVVLTVIVLGVAGYFLAPYLVPPPDQNEFPALKRSSEYSDIKNPRGH